MNRKLQKILVAWLLFFSTHLYAQTISVQGPATPISLCSSQQYSATITGSGLLNGNFHIVTPHSSITVAFSGSFSGGNTGNDYWVTLQNAQSPVTISYTIQVNCDFTNSLSGSNTNIVTRTNQLSFGTTQVNQSYDITFFYLLYNSSSSLNSNMIANATYQQTITRAFEIKNSGPMAYNGLIDVTDNPSSNSVQVKKIRFKGVDYSGGSPVVTQLGPDFLSSTASINLQSYGFSLNATHALLIEEEVQAVGCLDQSVSSDLIVLNGCSGNLCHDAGTSLPGIVVNKDPGVHEIRVTRNLPVNLNERIFPNGIIHYSFAIKNTGTVRLDQVKIVLNKQNVNSFYYVDPASIDFNFGGAFTQDPDVMLGSGPGIFPSCLLPASAMIFSRTWNVTQFTTGQTVLLDFDLVFCCPQEFDVFNADKYFNTFQLEVWAEDECGDDINLGGPVNHSIVQGVPAAYTAGWRIGATPMLNVGTSFEPTVTDMTDWNYNPDCDLDGKQPFEMEFTSITNGAELFFCNVPGGAPNAELIVEFDLEQGLTLEPNLPADLYLTDNNITLNYSGSVSATYGTTIPQTNQPGSIFRVRFPVDPSTFPTFQQFRSFLESAVLHFKMSPCCPTTNYSPKYYIRTYLNQRYGGTSAIPECWIPLTQQGSFILVHCPGCTTPGIIVTGSSAVRQTYGFADSDNDGLPDNPLTAVTASDCQSPGSPIRCGRSMTGDIVNVTTNGTFWGGSAAGFTLAQWNAVYNPQGYYADYLHLEQTLSHSNAGELNWTFLSGTATVTTASSNACLGGNTASFAITPGMVQRVGDKYCLIIRASYFSPCFHFNAGDAYSISLQYQICGDFTPPYSVMQPNPNDAKKVIDITNSMYMSADQGANCSLWGLVSTAQDYLNYLSTHQLNIHNPANYPIQDVIFNCENGGGRHYFYATERVNYIQWSAAYNATCKKTVTNTAVVRVGGGAVNVFPFEVRPPGVPERIRVNIPPGYSLQSYVDPTQPTVSVFPYYWLDPLTGAKMVARYQAIGIFGMPVLPNGGGAVWNAPASGNFTVAQHYDQVMEGMALNNPSYLYYQPAILNPWNPGKMLLGDEYLEQITKFELEPQCQTLATMSDTSHFSMSTVQDIFSVGPCNPVSTSVNGIGYIYFTQHPPGSGNYALTNPDPVLALNDLSSPVQATGLQVTWNLVFANTDQNFPAEHPYIFVPQDPHFQLTQAYVNGVSVPITASTSGPLGSFIYLNQTVPTNSTVQVTLTGTYSCSSPGSLYSFPVQYGWNCNSNPVDISQVCDVNQQMLSLRENESNLIANSCFFSALGSATSTGSYTLCQGNTLHATFNNNFNGGMFNLIFNYQLPPGMLPSQQISLGIYQAYITLNPASGGIATPCSLVSLGGGAYRIDLSGNAWQSFWGINGWTGTLVVKFDVITDCSYLGAPASVTATGTSYCSAVVTTPVKPSQAWVYAGNSCTQGCCQTTAGFNITPCKRCGKFKFWNTSTVNPNSLTMQYQWDFGDGGSSTQANPWHTYGANGTYVVTLVVNSVNASGTIICSSTTQQTVNVNCHCHRVTAQFEWTRSEGPCTYTFTDRSYSDEDGVFTYRWEIGEEPVFEYEGGPEFRYTFHQPGVYVVYEEVILTRPDGSSCSSTFAMEVPVEDCEVNCEVPISIVPQEECRFLSFYAPPLWCSERHAAEIIWRINGEEFLQEGDRPIMVEIREPEMEVCLRYICRSENGEGDCEEEHCYHLSVQDGCVLILDGEEYWRAPARMRESISAMDFMIVPNPVSGKPFEVIPRFNTVYEGQYFVRILNEQGSVVYSGAGQGAESHLVKTRLAAGIYSVVLYGESFRMVRRMVVLN